ncbi:phosphoribosylglycinamide formyltransferase [Pusillimonas sp. CC-YST705]|uniref:Phosphoribosylglycinamide formyltransferase n=1 Tax=Mesopusillimonas faecipullorum TaxID=2755040 RepID=A0ABS8C808_9BURK|nr:phosphoribosylglycinamide formyltransferase [Mesopusillimonas faecipullorum]MCB5362165.1 phosphoribosylglycinamide formyltransferase [Mesopusillimonas faecipullorum]
MQLPGLSEGYILQPKLFSASRPCRVVILVSGRGSNMQALVQAASRQAMPVQVCAVISNQMDAPALQWAREQGLRTASLPHRNYQSREQFDEALANEIEAHEPDYVLLAGFMRVLTDGFVRRFHGRLINIHPSLLPAFPGLNTHRRALDAGVAWHGCTVHFVTPEVDEGPIIAQWAVPVLANDNEETLAMRVLQSEHRLYAQVLSWLTQGRVSLDALGKVYLTDVGCRSFASTPNEQDAA